MQIKRKHLLLLDAALGALAPVVRAPKLAYAIAKNRRACRDEIEAIQAADQPDKKFAEYEAKRQSLCQAHARKTEKGEPVQAAGRYVIEDQATFDRDLGVLRSCFQSAIDARDQQIDTFRPFLEEPVEITFHQIGFAAFEADGAIDKAAPPLADFIAPLLDYIIVDDVN